VRRGDVGIDGGLVHGWEFIVGRLEAKKRNVEC